MSDIDHPNHYNQGSIECWDYIASHKMSFFQGNIIKYVTRYKDKNGKEDLKKAMVYLKKLMEVEYPSINLRSDCTVIIIDEENKEKK